MFCFFGHLGTARQDVNTTLTHYLLIESLGLGTPSIFNNHLELCFGPPCE